jgi:hypothetical protein
MILKVVNDEGIFEKLIKLNKKVLINFRRMICLGFAHILKEHFEEDQRKINLIFIE